MLPDDSDLFVFAIFSELTRKHAEDLGALNALVEDNRVTMEQITHKRKMDEAKEEAWLKTCSDLEFQVGPITFRVLVVLDLY